MAPGTGIDLPTTRAARGSERLDSGVWRSVLPGGTQVLSERIDSVRSVAVGFWFRRGTAHEAPDIRGAAHLLEHMVFKGTGRRSAYHIAAEIEGLGGAIDAYTTHEHTSFQVRLPAESLERGVDVLADIAFHPSLREGDLELERSVVLEELKRVEETPEDLVFDLHADFLYAGHPYGSPILGTRESMGAIDLKALRRLHADAYRAANLVVAAAGCVEHDHLVDLLVPRIPEVTPDGDVGLDAPSTTATGTRRVERPGGRQVHLVAGARGVEHGHPLRHATVLVSTALGAGMSSRLFQRVREELGLAYNVFSFQSFYGLGGHVGAYVGTGEATAGEARGTLEAELRSLAESGLTAAEETATKEQVKGQLMISLEGPPARMHRLASYALFGEPYRSLDELTARIEAVSHDELAAAAELFHPDRLAVLELWPA